jgi:choline dehydrogenase-like flavoprotein
MIETLCAGKSKGLKADVTVIGAGTVGLVVAARLAEKGLSVVCLESGLKSQAEEEHPLNAVVHSKRIYSGAAQGRFRCLGGTSTRWGGALIPFLKQDLDPKEWPIAYEEILQFAPPVESLFGLTPGPYTVEELDGIALPQFVARLAKWPPFARRNVAHLMRDALSSLPNLQIWLNSTATAFDVRGGRIVSVTARSLDGGEVLVEADDVIFAAGALESTRLLLLLDSQNSNSVFGPDDQLGRFFSDHLSARIAYLDPQDRIALNRLMGFRFEKRGVMRNVRFELAANSVLRKSTRPFFAHIAFETNEKSGFTAIRELFRLMQKGRLPSSAALLDLALAAPWLVQAIWWRCFEKRLLYPDTASIQLHIVMEQVPRAENRITLARDTVDAFGLPLAKIAWDITQEDQNNIERAATAFELAWEQSALSSVAKLHPSHDLFKDLAGFGGIFHPVGSTRIGATPKSAVVDANLRPFRLRNAMILSTSVFPTSGGANPTMMLMMLAFRCVELLANKFQAR